MMIPPLIRFGQPPAPDGRHWPSYVVLVKGRGWFIAKWHRAYAGVMVDNDQRGPQHAGIILGNDVLCWMPEDGS